MKCVFLLFSRRFNDRHGELFTAEVLNRKAAALVGCHSLQHAEGIERAVAVENAEGHGDADIVEILEPAQPRPERGASGALKGLAVKTLSADALDFKAELFEDPVGVAAFAADDHCAGSGGEVRLIVEIHVERPVRVEPCVKRGGCAAEHTQAERRHQMLAQGIAARGQRIVDPTASPLDQAILDALQGVQTPENVTQTREATALDNIIMAAMNQNKNSATPEQTTESPINGPVRSDAAEAGTSNINAASEKIKGDFDKLIEGTKGNCLSTSG